MEYNFDKEKAAGANQTANQITHPNHNNNHSKTQRNSTLKGSELPTLKVALVSRLDELLRTLLPDKHVTSLCDGWRFGNHGSLSVTVEGVFFDHEAGIGGDVFDLLQHVMRCDFRTALFWAQGFIGNTQVILTPKEFSEKARKDPALHERQRMDKALRLWRNAIAPQHTLAETYLRHRGITVALPVSIRFMPRAWNYTSGFHPALIAAAQNPQGKITAAQVIYLTEDAIKINGKDVQPKLTYGLMKGSAVRLSPLRESLIISGGLEDGLSLLQSFPDSCVWASLGTSNLMGVQLPDSLKKVVIAADKDKGGLHAARMLAKRLMQEGRQVKIALPSHGKDFNEMLQSGRNHHAK